MLSERDYKKIHFLIQILYLAVFALIAYFCFNYILGAVAPFIIALVASVIVEPIVQRLVHKLKFPRPVASTICMVILLLFVILIGIILSRTIWSEGKQIIENIPSYIRSILNSVRELSESNSGLMAFVPDDAVDHILDTLYNIDYSQLVPQIVNGSVGSLILGYAGNVVTYIPNALIFFIVTVVSSIFMSVSFPVVKGFILRQFKPKHRSLIIEIKKNLFSTIGQYLRSYSLLLLLTFSELLIFFLIFQFKPALPLALGIALVDILPVLGIGTILIPWSLISLLTGEPWRALILICIYIVLTIVRQIMEPKIIGDHVGLLPIVTLFCIWVGLKLFGFGGFFIVPIAVVILKNLQEAGKIHIWKEKGE